MSSHRFGPFILLLTLCAAFLVGCGGSSGDNGTAAPAPPTPPPAGGILAGTAGSPAIDAMPATDIGAALAADFGGDGRLLSRMGVLFLPGATVGQVNAAAAAVEAGLAFSQPQSLMAVLAVPRQPDLAALLAQVDLLNQQPGVAGAWSMAALATGRLPGEETGTPIPAADLAYLLPMRFPAAWNAANLLAGCESRRVPVLVLDVFDEPVPAAFLERIPATSFTGDPTNLPLPSGSKDRGDHGYLVTQVMAALPDGGRPTGAHPDAACLSIEPVGAGGLSAEEAILKLGGRIASIGGPTILQSSLAFRPPLCDQDGNCLDESEAYEPSGELLRQSLIERIATAIRWAGFLGAGDNASLLIIDSAGNDADNVMGQRYAGLRDASLASSFAMVTTLPDLADAWGSEGSGAAGWIPRLSNGATDPTRPNIALEPEVLLILQDEFDQTGKSAFTGALNVATVGALGRPPGGVVTSAETLSRAAFSNPGASLYAVAEGMQLGALNDLGEDNFSGTSFAAPQVSGLAAYLWLLSDALRSREVADTLALIEVTAQHGAAGDPGIVDAYQAVLALDRLDPQQAVRRAILDVNGDGRFDEDDLEAYVAAFEEYGGGQTAVIPDFSRFDLNGDGFTGGSRAAPMQLEPGNLPLTAEPEFGVLVILVEDEPEIFNQAEVTDLQALCYFAYRTDPQLYTGSPDRREELLGAERCSRPVTLSAVFPQSFSGNADLDIEARRVDETGESQPLAGVPLRFSPTCAVIATPTGFTDENGRFNVLVTPAADCTEVSVLVEALDSLEEGSRVFASIGVSASVLTGEPTDPGGTGVPVEARNRLGLVSFVPSARFRSGGGALRTQFFFDQGFDLIDDRSMSNGLPAEPFAYDEEEPLIRTISSPGLGSATFTINLRYSENLSGIGAGGFGSPAGIVNLSATCSAEVFHEPGVSRSCSVDTANPGNPSPPANCWEPRGMAHAQFSLSVRDNVNHAVLANVAVNATLTGVSDPALNLPRDQTRVIAPIPDDFNLDVLGSESGVPGAAVSASRSGTAVESSFSFEVEVIVQCEGVDDDAYPLKSEATLNFSAQGVSGD